MWGLELQGIYPVGIGCWRPEDPNFSNFARPKNGLIGHVVYIKAQVYKNDQGANRGDLWFYFIFIFSL
jgi:hypothetical protein